MQTSEHPTRPDDEDPREESNDSPLGVSVIVFEDAEHHGKLIADMRASFQRRGTPIEFIIVSAEGPRLAPLSGTQHAESVQSFDAAIRLARHENIAVADAVYDFDAAHWQIVDPANRHDAFRSWSYSPSRAPGSRKLLVWIYCMVVRLLFGVSKNPIAPGIVTFRKSQLTGIDTSRLELNTTDSVTQLLAVAKSKGRRVEEHRCNFRQPDLEWHKKNSIGPHFPKSKSIKRSIKRNLQFWFSELAFPARLNETNHVSSPRNLAIATAMLLIVAGTMLFANSSYPLFEPDETRNAQLAINIAETGNWGSLSLADEPYWDKPPLLAWLTAISYECFGISEWATRLPSIISSLCLLGLMMLAGTKLIGLRATTFGAASLLLAWGFSFQTRYATMDALLMLFTTATILGIAVGVMQDGSRKFRKGWLIVSGISLGLGLLTKGPICLVLTVPPIVAWMVLNRDISRDAKRATMKLVAIPAILVAAPWFVLTTLTNPEFAWYFLWKHHVLRFSDAFNHQEPFWYYLPILWLFMFPASILLPRVIYVAVARKQKYRRFQTPTHGLLLMSTLWIVGFFSMSQCKLPAYILPAFPLIALLTGVIANFEIGRSTGIRTRFDRLPRRIAIGVCVLTWVVSGISILQFGSVDFGSLTLFALANLASVVLLVTFPLKRSSPKTASWLATLAIGMIFVFLGVNKLVPSIALDRSILLSIAQQQTADQPQTVVYFGRDAFGAGLYLPESSVVQIDEDSPEQVGQILAQSGAATIVASDSNISMLKATFGDAISISQPIGRHTFRVSASPERIATGTRPTTTHK
ncbi:ArnT family glycosyltransferase [Mariniblastus fucicola]|uniref:Undecaprenyl phosphate-alpha-4-amino-4-deoxy-L-arabinose arabinosyl transferase n=1 Tax=Mariniblastus fucicola TaxID=980251 RepID=A0A5B9PKS8_9BACT|nr:glycosyltransferase family 39 protein [Mariniblastus fucicola]QEG23261.1 Undecaprenyl phosphate-alpha-4-amino-4-deoxy-L-arabinose arabinosyl transferase [Mariniblastus fucicola]